MKKTTFEFGFRATDGDLEALRKLLRETLKPIEGVEEILVDGTSPMFTLRIHAVFADGEAAKRMHRKIVSKLKKLSALVVTFARSNLSEIFD